MGSRAFQAPLSSKPKLYQFLLDAAHKLPVSRGHIGVRVAAYLAITCSDAAHICTNILAKSNS
jgi:hypothetical protein